MLDSIIYLPIDQRREIPAVSVDEHVLRSEI